MVNGRDKGRRGELNVASIIRDWWAAHEPAALFIRTPLSGGWSSNTKAAAHFKASGDIMTTSPSFPFCVEVKYREQWVVGSFLDGKRSPVWSWWEQTVTAAVKQDAIPMLWLRRNRIPGQRTPFPWIVVLPHDFMEARTLDRPDMTWTLMSLAMNGVDLPIVPCGYDSQRFLAMDPRRMLEGARRGGTVPA